MPTYSPREAALVVGEAGEAIIAERRGCGEAAGSWTSSDASVDSDLVLTEGERSGGGLLGVSSVRPARRRDPLPLQPCCAQPALPVHKWE